MSAGQVPEVTQLLQAWSSGDKTAFDQLIPIVYAELRRLAHRQLQGEVPSHILRTTALVHEVYLRLVDGREVDWHNRAQFFALAGQVMRHVLVDEARGRRAAKRGGEALHVSLDAGDALALQRGADVVALDDALHALALNTIPGKSESWNFGISPG